MGAEEHVIRDRIGPFAAASVAPPEVYDCFDGALIAGLASAFEALRAGGVGGRERVRASCGERVHARGTEGV